MNSRLQIASVAMTVRVSGALLSESSNSIFSKPRSHSRGGSKRSEKDFATSSQCLKSKLGAPLRSFFHQIYIEFAYILLQSHTRHHTFDTFIRLNVTSSISSQGDQAPRSILVPIK